MIFLFSVICEFVNCLRSQDQPLISKYINLKKTRKTPDGGSLEIRINMAHLTKHCIETTVKRDILYVIVFVIIYTQKGRG